MAAPLAQRGPNGGHRSDTDIKLNIDGELPCCPQVDESGIAFKVTDGIVALGGYVCNFFSKYGAEDAVKRVAGVIVIANDIQAYSSQASTAAAVAAVRAVKGVVCVVNTIAAAPRGQPVRPEYIKGLIEESFRRAGIYLLFHAYTRKEARLLLDA